MNWIVTLFALTLPPSPMLYRAFETKAEAERWRDWATSLPFPAMQELRG